MIVTLLAAFFYLFATGLAIRALYQSKSPWLERAVAAFAIVTHAIAVHQLIDTHLGQNLSFLNILAQVACLIALFAFLLRLKKQDSPLAILAYPFALLSLITAALHSGQNIIVTKDNLPSLIHILFAIFTFSILSLAALQAIVCVIQERILTHKGGLQFIGTVPPLQRSEKLLFQLIAFGFVLLSALLLSSFYLFNNPFSPLLIEKTLLAIMAWGVFAVLLFGRQYHGWRGKKAVRYASAGVLMLALLILISVFRG